MTGKQLVKLLTCIIDEQKVKWGRHSLHPSKDTYCALGLLAKGAGVTEEMFFNFNDSLYPDDNNPLNKIPTLNDDAKSFFDFCARLRRSNLNFPVKEHLARLKKLVKGHKAGV